MKMVRKQVYITEEQDKLLKQLSQARGQSEAEIIRHALDGLSSVNDERANTATGSVREAALLEYQVDRHDYSWRELINSARRREMAEEAWQAELAFMRSLASDAESTKSGGEAWRFNRDEVYEERLDKILRRH